MNKYIDDLIEKHAPYETYLISFPQAAAAIREGMEKQAKACAEVWLMDVYTATESGYETLRKRNPLYKKIRKARVEGDE
jgi:hypothetical protein